MSARPDDDARVVRARARSCARGPCSSRATYPLRLLFRQSLLAQGYSDAELLRLRRSGALSTVRGGAYLPPGDDRLERPENRHALLVDSTLPRLAPGAVVSHVSAAVDEIVGRDGKLVTTAARMLVDIARTQPFDQAVAIIDQALGKEPLHGRGPGGVVRSRITSTRRAWSETRTAIR